MRVNHLMTAAATAFAIAGCSPANAPAPSSPPAPTLTGAWRSRLTVRDGAWASMHGLEFLYAFNAGGTMTESSNFDEAAPVPPAYGIWKETAPSTFVAKYVYYNTQPPKHEQELLGGGGWTPTGPGVITETITLSADGQSFRSTIEYQMFDSAGKPAPGGGHAAGSGTRIQF